MKIANCVSWWKMGVAAILFALLTATLQVPASACSCLPPPPPKQAMEGSAAVFSGKVIKVETADFVTRATIQVDRVWKGDVTETMVVTTCSDGACCGYNFAEGQSDLVYAHKAKDAANYSVSLCSRTRRSAHAAEDLKELGEGQAPKKN